MQSRERQGGSAQGCGSAAGGQVAELQPWDLEAATDKFVEQVRQSARQHAVVVGAFGVRERRRGATVRLMRRVHVRNEQEQVRMLTEENAALRMQLALQAERLRADAMLEVCVVCLLHVGICQAALHQRLVQISWNIYLYIWLRCRNDLVVCFCVTYERVKKPAAIVLNDIRLSWLLVFHSECLCALYMQMRLKYRIHKKYCRQRK